MSTLPKGLRKKNNIKALLRQHPGAQVCGQQRIRGRNEDVLSCPLPHPQSWKTRGRRTHEGARAWRLEWQCPPGSSKSQRIRTWGVEGKGTKEEAAILNKKTVTTQGEEVGENRTEIAAGNKLRKRK